VGEDFYGRGEKFRPKGAEGKLLGRYRRGSLAKKSGAIQQKGLRVEGLEGSKRTKNGLGTLRGGERKSREESAIDSERSRRAP